jgi:diaminopimelate epimerase
MRIWNADGGQVDACGNATRCVGWLLLEQNQADAASIETNAGLIAVERAGARKVRVDMGEPRLNWWEIPLAEPVETASLDIKAEPNLVGPGAVSMGNPHMVFFVADVEALSIHEIGPALEHHPLYPERANVGFAEIKAKDRMRLRVWERGAGLTKACGTGACAAVVAAARRGLTGRKVAVEMDGGELIIEWREADNHVLMTGPVAFEFTGTLDDGARAA